MENQKKMHPTTVVGFDGDLKKLAFLIVGLRFDVLGEFFGYFAEALREAAAADEAKGKVVLARMLAIAAGQAENLKWFFWVIFQRCVPHMSEELHSD